MEKRKSSGIELLRVVSMFFILVLHANMFTFGRPESYSTTSLLSYFVTSVTIIGINCFALITGYFGTRFRVIKIVGLLFQCCFCVLPIALVLYLIGAFKVEGYGALISNFWPFNYWYIIAYIGLLIISPMLNAAIEIMPKSKIWYGIGAFYCYILVFDVAMRDTATGVEGGYSMVWLVFLYILGRMLKQIRIDKISIKKILVVFVVCVFFKTILCFCHINGYRYTNPTILVSSICFFLLFVKMRFSSKFVNWLGASATMVYLLNLQPQVIVYYKQTVRWLYYSFELPMFCVMVVTFCAVFFLISVWYDNLRQMLWNPVLRCIEPHINKFNSKME